MRAAARKPAAREPQHDSGNDRHGPMAEALNSSAAVGEQMQLAEALNRPRGVAQRVLNIAGSDVTADEIARQSSYKRKFNTVISPEARAAHKKPVEVRNELVAMADSDEEFSFDTKRDAVIAAIGRITGVTDAEEKLFDAMDGHDAFEGFPKESAWRLVMDGKQQHRGKFGFENEKGYMAAMMGAFTRMLDGLDDELTAASYEELHDLAVGGVLDRAGKKMEKGFRNSKDYGEGFGVDQDTWSEEGYEELLEKYRNRGPKNVKDERYPEGHPVGAALAEKPEKMVGPGVPRKVMQIRPMLAAACEEAATSVIGVFHQEIAEAETEDAKLEAIARCAQDLDQLHLFADGNIRTIAFLVVNKLLLQNGLTPVILKEPNVFDCKSVAELKAALREGQRLFNRYMPEG
jgi:prophage maintenance system killer protein